MRCSHKIAKEIILNAFSWEVFQDGSVGVDLRGNKHLSDLNLDAETEIFVRQTIGNHIAFKIAEMGARSNARLIQEERARKQRMQEVERKEDGT